MNTIKYFMIGTVMLCGFYGCSSDNDSDFTDELAAPEYDLKKGTPGSVDEKIYQIHEKYGTYILYSFDEKDFKRKWIGSWSTWYAPANTSDNLKYVEKIVTLLEEKVLSKYDESFIRKNFPYKVFLVDTLCENSSSYNKRRAKNVLSNGNNAIAISNVGVASDKWKQKEWQQLAIELDKAFSMFYYSSLKEKPIKFISLRFGKLFFPTVTDPENVYSKYTYSCYSVGYVAGKLNGYLSPDESLDFADFIRLMVGTEGTELKRIFSRFPIMKERAAALCGFMKSHMQTDLIATQNTNFPEDKLPLNIFD